MTGPSPSQWPEESSDHRPDNRQRPTHPVLPATLLMVGIIVFLIVVSVAATF